MILRPPVVYGPREENLYSFFKMLNKGWLLQIGETRRLLSLVYVLDLGCLHPPLLCAPMCSPHARTRVSSNPMPSCLTCVVHLMSSTQRVWKVCVCDGGRAYIVGLHIDT